ncbi:MAG: UDP-N-acetylmuramate--L-alanine ligase [Anaerolineaceae bacterium]|nr:UDP-N-acetylmuramate--L-alanine ligase [Anaerolineaceae bacterium]
MTHVHLIGIGGTGLSAIARVLLEKGYQVSGSDRQASPLFDAVTKAGATTYVGHVAEQAAGADLVVRSSAVPEDNPEVQYALAHQIPVLKRSDFLAELTQGQDVLAVAGTHGKTTTTTMLIWMLTEMGLDPSFIAGGVVNQLDRNAHAGQGDYFVIEADEYDNMFLGLAPKIAIVTNVEHDHPDCFPTPQDYRKAFKAFLGKVRPDGLAFICQDDPGAAALGVEMSASEVILTYGSQPEVDYRAVDYAVVNGWPTFTIMHGNEALGQVKLSVPGWHNVLNATGALGAIHRLGLDLPAAIQALAAFTGAGRRFEVLGEVSGVTIIDDYGHHPTEIAATLEAAHSRYPDHRIWAIWQPHTYSRTQSLEAEFIRALAIADRVGVLKIYAAREKDPGYSTKVIAEALPAGKAAYLDDFGAATDYLLKEIKPDDVLIVFSAGDATQVSQSVYQQLAAKEIG